MKRKGLFFVALTMLLCVFSLCFVACSENPHEHDYKMQASETMHWLKCDCGDMKDFNSHSGGTATEEEKAVCEICNSVYGTTLNHTHNFNEQEVKDKYLAKEATCTEKAEYYYSCKCGERGNATFEVGVISNCDFVEGNCRFCEKVKTLNLEYTLINNCQYEVSLGTCTDVAIYIPHTYNNKPVASIKQEAFANYENLQSIEIPSSITNIGYMSFAGCFNLQSITVAKENVSYKSIDGNLYTKDGKTLIQYAIGKTATSFITPNDITSIGAYAFAFCNALQSVQLANSITALGEGAFGMCTSLQNIEIPFGVTIIKNSTFWNCTNLQSIKIPNSVTIIEEQALFQCGLKSIVIPNSVTSIGDWAFKGCDSLQYKEKNGLKYLGNTTNEYLYLAEAVNKDITSATIDNGCKFIGYDAFKGCESLQSIEIPSSVTSIGEGAFYYCRSLTSVTIGDSVTSIGDYAFYYCFSLTSVTIGNSVTSIGDYAFSSRNNLQSISFGGTMEQWKNAVLNKETEYYGMVVCIDGTIKASGWAPLA